MTREIWKHSIQLRAITFDWKFCICVVKQWKSARQLHKYYRKCIKFRCKNWRKMVNLYRKYIVSYPNFFIFNIKFMFSYDNWKFPSLTTNGSNDAHRVIALNALEVRVFLVNCHAAVKNGMFGTITLSNWPAADNSDRNSNDRCSWFI